jgi:citronellol/citronellal dehydrogenase
MSICILDLRREFSRDGITFNAIWPRTTIATVAVINHLGDDLMIAKSRTMDHGGCCRYHCHRKQSRVFWQYLY